MNLTEITAAVTLLSSRGDVAADIGTYLKLAEPKIQRRLRSEAMRVIDDALTLSGGSRTVALPSLTLEVEAVWIGTVQARYESPRRLLGRISTGTGTPKFYTVAEGNLEFDVAPAADTTVTLVYIQGLDLAGDTTNTISELAPEIYVHALLCEIWRKAKDWPALQEASASLQFAIGEFNQQQRRRDKSGGATLRVEASDLVGAETFDINEG